MRCAGGPLCAGDAVGRCGAGIRANLARPADPADRALRAGRPDRHSGAAASQILPKLGQPAVVENRPGAGGAIGARAVATAAPDGYTLLVGNTSVLAVIPAVSASAGYDPAKSFAPVAKISESYQILVVHPATPWTSVKRTRRRREGQSGQVQHRAHRRGRPAASCRRAVQGERRRRSRRRALQERRRSRHRAARRQGARDLRGDHDPAAADPRGKGARARRDQPHAARRSRAICRR